MKFWWLLWLLLACLGCLYAGLIFPMETSPAPSPRLPGETVVPGAAGSPFPTPRPAPTPVALTFDVCVGEIVRIAPVSPTDIYHYIDLALTDVTPEAGVLAVRYVRGQVTLLSDTSAILAYRPDDVHPQPALAFQARQPGEVAGTLTVLTESLSPYGYSLLPLQTHRIRVRACE